MVAGVAAAGALVLFAFARTWNKTELEVRLHINEKLVQESTFGESPTFAIWIEDPETGTVQTVFVTDRAGRGDWEGKAEVPVALPSWFEVNEKEKLERHKPGEKVPDEMAITGATPKPGYFTTRVRLAPGKRWICRIEVNEAGDFNDKYKEYDDVNQTSDEFKTGQPALLYKAEILAKAGEGAKAVIEGISMLDNANRVHVQPAEGITTAKDIFDEISIRVIKPKPRIIEW